MLSICRSYVAVCLVLLLATRLVAEQQPPSPQFMPVRVILRDEREFIAYVDERSDDELLWLRFSRGMTTLSTGFTWDLVRSVDVGVDRYTAAEFRDSAMFFASGQTLHLHRPSSESVPEIGMAASDSPFNRHISVRPRVQSLSITAHVANWDRDADMDGIELQLIPRDTRGEVIPIQGSIKVELLGRSYSPVRGSLPFTLGKWSQSVPLNAFSNRKEVICRLPFLSGSFDDNSEFQAMGLLRVQLNVAGQGDFFAESSVRVRTYNPIRDELLNQGQHQDAFGRYRARHW
jgi:hypothetical protein